VKEYYLEDPPVEIYFVCNTGEAVGYFFHHSGGPDYIAIKDMLFVASPELKKAIYRIFDQ